MFTKNYNEFLQNANGLAPAFSASTVICLDGSLPSDLKTYEGGREVRYYSPFNRMHIFASGETINAKTGATEGVAFGDGTVPPTADDITFSGNAIEGLSSSNITYTSNVVRGEGYVEKTLVYTITNTTEAAISIGEIGYFNYVSSTQSDYPYKSDKRSYMLERTLLETPITIEAGGVGQVTYTLRMNDPIGAVTTESTPLLPLVWEESAEYSEAVAMTGLIADRAVKLSDEVVDLEYWVGKKMTVEWDSGDPFELVLTAEDISSEDGLYALQDLIYIVTADSGVTLGGATLSKGIWAGDNYNDACVAAFEKKPVRIEISES